MSDAHALESVRAVLTMLRDPRAWFVSKDTALLMITDALESPEVVIEVRGDPVTAEEAELMERDLS